jgi:polyphosphate kinase 2 (PPK2 family)
MDKRHRLSDVIEPMLVAPGSKVKLSRDHDPAATGRLARPEAGPLLERGVDLLAEYQDKLAAQDALGLLVVLQGLDASGKDSTIKHVMSGLNPQGVAVRSFKEPSTEDLGHDFLWRYQCALPSRGRIGIFNRSHYEEVLVARVHPELLAAERDSSSASIIRRRTGSSPPAMCGSAATGTRAVNPQYPSADPAAAEEMAKARSGLVAELAASPR